MVTPPGSSIDAGDATVPAEVAASAAGPPYKSGRSSQKAPADTMPVAAAAVAVARQGGHSRPEGAARSEEPKVGSADAAAVMASALGADTADKADKAGGEAVPTAPRNPWAAPPEATDATVASGGILKVASVAPVDASDVAAAVAEGVARDRAGSGLGQMARTRVGEAPPWERLEKQKVLDAWHTCGGAVDDLARMLTDADGAMAAV